MFDDDNDGEGRHDDAASGSSWLVVQTRRTLAISYAIEERLRATGHLRGFAAAAGRDVVTATSRSPLLTACPGTPWRCQQAA